MSRMGISTRVRRLVRERAGGRCEYCLLPEPDSIIRHQLDHILARKHQGRNSAANLAYCCALCNKHKGSDVSSVDTITGRLEPLFHPRLHLWTEHFRVVGLRITPLSGVGRVTIRLLQLNHPDRIAERRVRRATGLIWP